jgi:hypothetical protein
MPHVRYNKSHPAGATPEARIANRLRNSGDTKNADSVVQKGTGPTRTFHNIHHGADQLPPPNVRGRNIRQTAKG